MSYPSIDALQKALSAGVFSHTKDAKKAAGRALGTMIEIISYYLLRQWGMADSLSIERGLTEYGNQSISHNVEFALHPICDSIRVKIADKLPLTASKMSMALNLDSSFTVKSQTLLDSRNVVRNACVIAENDDFLVVASDVSKVELSYNVGVNILRKSPYAMLECKRVGIEEGNRKGPQTIEKAKQGAYVARATSSLQKIRDDQGNELGVIYDSGTPLIKPYRQLLSDVIKGDSSALLKGFTMSVGVVSNHGNWFTSSDQNKELKVLAQAYDRLLFLSDNGLAQFVTDLIIEPSEEYQAVGRAFYSSYSEGKKTNIFTKVRMSHDAHQALVKYFADNITQIEGWFNVITPEGEDISSLRSDLSVLKNKDWRAIL